MAIEKITKLRTEKNAIENEFQEFSAYYDSHVFAGEVVHGVQFSYFALDRLLSLVYETINLQGKETVLDVGTGTAALAEKLKQTHPRLAITGIDISGAMLEKAREKGCLDSAKVADVEEGIPFDNGLFDIVISCGVFEFIRDDRALVDEMARVTADNGYMAFAAVQSEELADIQIPGFSRLVYEQALGYRINMNGQETQEADYIYAIFRKTASG